MTEDELQAKAKAYSAAADLAFRDSDFEHEKEMRKMAARCRRQAREVAAGLPYEETLWRDDA